MAKHTPIFVFDGRIIDHLGTHYRQSGSKPGIPIDIEVNKNPNSRQQPNRWTTPQSEIWHTQENWDRLLKEGTIVKSPT